MSVSPNLNLPLIATGQVQKHVTINEALIALDGLMQLAVDGGPEDTPPIDPSEGSRWLVSDSPVGAWSDQAGKLAIWLDGGWRFHSPRRGWVAYGGLTGRLLVYTGTEWAEPAAPIALQNLDLVGVGTTADVSNPLSAKLNNILLTALPPGEGGDGDLRVKLNKQTGGDTGSLVFQTGYSGRAELGLTGDDDFHLKVSANGSTWREAVRVDRSTGGVSMRFFDSHQVSVGFEAVVAVQPPSSGGIVIASLVDANYPQNAVSSILAYDVGNSPLLTTMVLGASAENLGTTVLTGASGAAGKVAFAVDSSGHLYIQNRFTGGIARQICLTYINSYRAIS